MSEILSPFSDDKLGLFHQAKLAQVAAGNLVTPVTVEVDLTDNACNQACVHCTFSSGEGDVSDLRKIDPERIVAVLGEMHGLGTNGVEFVGGGEPTMHDQFVGIANDTLETGIELGLISNGVIGRRITDVAANHPEGGFKYVRISLDSVNEPTYNKLHGVAAQRPLKPAGGTPVEMGRGDLRRVQGTIESLRQIFPKIVGAGEPKLGLGYVVIPPYNNSYDEVAAAFEYADRVGVDYLVLRPAQLPDQIHLEVWQETYRDIRRLMAEYSDSYTLFDAGSETRWDIITSGEHPTGKCFSKPLVAIIKADGTIAHCNLLRGRDDLAIGNIHSGSFAEQWFSSVHREAWQSFVVDGCPNPCKHYTYNKVAKDFKNGTAVSISDRSPAHLNHV